MEKHFVRMLEYSDNVVVEYVDKFHDAVSSWSANLKKHGVVIKSRKVGHETFLEIIIDLNYITTSKNVIYNDAKRGFEQYKLKEFLTKI